MKIYQVDAFTNEKFKGDPAVVCILPADFKADEDPLTGSTHCSLVSFWAERLAKIKKTALQLSSRGGALEVELKVDRVEISGQATTVFKGEFV